LLLVQGAPVDDKILARRALDAHSIVVNAPGGGPMNLSTFKPDVQTVSQTALEP